MESEVFHHHQLHQHATFPFPIPISSNSKNLAPLESYGVSSSLPVKQKLPKTETLSVKALKFLKNLDPYIFMPYRYSEWSSADNIRTISPFVYRIKDGVSNNTILQAVCEERGWKEYIEPLRDRMDRMNRLERELHSNSTWNIWWSYNFYQGSPYRTLKCWQHTNHNPRAFLFCNKSYLTSFLRKMSKEFGEVFDFSPKSFIMPEDYIRFVTEHTRRQEQDCPDAHNVIVEDRTVVTPPRTAQNYNSDFNNNFKRPQSKPREANSPIWILKPIGKSQGKGIFLTKDFGQVKNVSKCVIQEYISRPLLIGGYKWDIRIYICIASTDPLAVYLCREGLCRFATEKFDLKNLAASFSHLTNASLNKLGPDYPTEKNVIGSGCKWSLKQLRTYLKKSGISDWYLWQRIMALVLLTVVGEGLKTGYAFPASRNCFDFFGFDILVDENLRPWLLEVNYSPGLGGDCEVDEVVKKPMLHELFDLLGFPNCSKDKADGSTPKRPKSASGSRSRPSTSNIKSNINISTLRPVTSSGIVISQSGNVDMSCEARLKVASSIYSQDLVLQYFERRNRKLRMTPNLKMLLAAKKKALLIRQKKEQETDGKTSSSPEKLDDSSDSDAASSCPNATPNPTTDLDEGTSAVPSNTLPNKSLPDDEYSEGEAAPFIYLHRPDWNDAPKNGGNWVRVFPVESKGLPYRSPYRSSLADLRGILKTIENYLKIVGFVYTTYPNQSDAFYQSKVKAMSRWDTDIWFPPGQDSNGNLVPFLRDNNLCPDDNI